MSAVQQKTQPHTDLVVGLGATGLSVARYLRRTGRDARFLDTREQPPGVDELRAFWPEAELDLGATTLPQGVSRLVVSPGIRDAHPILAQARAAGIEIVSDIDLFVEAAAAPFVAVTGSNGKSTVTTLLEHMCIASGRTVLAGGNLGRPALDLLEDDVPDWYVLEVSSFQLQRTASLPATVAVLLNISPDHLDWHASETEYRDAKLRIFREASSAVFNRAQPDIVEQAERVGPGVSFGLDAPADGEFGRRIEDEHTFLARGQSLLLDTADLKLFGIHNQANALAALACGELMSLSMQGMLTVLCEFPGLPHRMQRVITRRSVTWVNDSKATNVAAAVASIDSVDGTLVLVAGGDGKGGDFAQLGPALAGKLRAAVLIGKDAETIAAAIADAGPVRLAADIEEAVVQAAELAEPGDTVLLAPACASLDQFDNYMARGDAFASAVGDLGS